MKYIIFDLEWNNAYNYKTQKGMNEIIEIGAIKLNEQLNMVDSFKQVIKPKFSKRLSGRFKKLTHITNEEVKLGLPFEQTLSDFKRWCSDDNCVFLSWSNSDLYVLADNYKKYYGNASIDFIKKYLDVQKYCQSFLDVANGNQISLFNCAERFNIEVDLDSLHRALADCYLTAECLKKVYEKVLFNEYIVDCDNNYFERLVFKQHYVTDFITNDFNINKVEYFCPNCNKKIKPVKPHDFLNNSFRAVGFCHSCKKKFWLQTRAKVTFDGVVVSSKVNVMNKKRAKKIQIDND